MRTSDVAAGYARSLYDMAVLSDAVDAVDEGLTAAASAVRGNLDLRTALADTSLHVEKKRAVLRDIFGDTVAPEALAMVTLLVERGRTDAIGEVARIFGEIAEQERGIQVAEVTTAVELDEAQRASITEKLTASVGRPVALRERVDPAILGGIRIKIAGRVLDGSIATQLEGMRRTLASAQGGEA